MRISPIAAAVAVLWASSAARAERPEPRRAMQRAAEARPEIPADIARRLPPGCRSTWDAGPGGVRVAAGDALLLDETAVAERAGDDLLAAPPSADDPLARLGPDSRADDPLADLGPAPEPVPPSGGAAGEAPPGGAKPPNDVAKDPHAALFAADSYPAATTCKECHPRHYDEWRASAHAYAAVSPMFQSFEQAITDLSQGTVGDFCMRCHSPVGTQLEFPRSASILDAPQVVREGITCVACHRVREQYGKTNGERRIEPGDVHAPVYGNLGGAGVAAAIADAARHKVKASPEDAGPGQPMHAAGFFFEPLTRSDFCVPCHQVAVHPGIALEVVWSQYRAGPAAAKGVSCQDCHMGAVPGKPAGYECGPVAELAGKPFGDGRKKTNHAFWGPGTSIAHPGIFPHNEKAQRWSPRQWLRFDWRSGWGTEAFERAAGAQQHADSRFPPPWDHADERRDARRVIDANLRRLDEKRRASIATMENAFRIEGPRFDAPPRVGRPLEFRFRVRSTSEGHNLPSGSLGAQPQLWLNVVLIGPDGQRLWESGHLDAYGDLADMHSRQVRRHELRPDLQLFNLQTKFLITGAKGTDREMPLPINVDVDQVPLLRPGAVPVSVLNHPPLIRMEAHSIPPLGHKTARYTVPVEALRGPGTYRLSVRMRSRMEPAYFMAFCGATPEMVRSMNEQILDLHPRSFTFDIHGGASRSPGSTR